MPDFVVVIEKKNDRTRKDKVLSLCLFYNKCQDKHVTGPLSFVVMICSCVAVKWTANRWKLEMEESVLFFIFCVNETLHVQEKKR